MAKHFVTHRPRLAAKQPAQRQAAPAQAKPPPAAGKAQDKPNEIGGPSGPEPTRYGDWERKGICVDF